MAVLRESPWYAEILQEGLQQGYKQGIEQGEMQMLRYILTHRFGEPDPDLLLRIRQASTEQLQRIATLALDVQSQDEVFDFVQRLTPQA